MRLKVRDSMQGGGPKMVWEGHIGLQSPKMKQDAKGVEGDMSGLQTPQPTRVFGEPCKLPQRDLGRIPNR